MVITDPSRLLPAGRTPRLLKAKHSHKVMCAGHLERGLEPELRAITLSNIIRILKHHDFDAIAFSGLSGALFAPMVAFALDKTLLAVRKGEQCHSSRLVEGDYAARRFVILDDFISCGDTMRHILDEIHEAVPEAECIGILEYCYIGRTTDPADALGSAHKYTRGRTQRPLSAWNELTEVKKSGYVPVVPDYVVQAQSLSLDAQIEKPIPQPVGFPMFEFPKMAPISLGELTAKYTNSNEGPTVEWAPLASGEVAVDIEASPQTTYTLEQIRKAVHTLRKNEATMPKLYRVIDGESTLIPWDDSQYVKMPETI